MGARVCLLGLAILGSALPVSAGEFRTPEGCSAWLTVQFRSCRVSNYYRCSTDAPGDQWRADFTAQGLNFRSRIDHETQWVEAHNSDGSIDLLEQPAPDPASFTELLATGRDTYDFSTLSSFGFRERMRGFDQLTGETVVIDGIALQRTKYELRVTREDGSLVWHARGNEFIHPEWRLFLSGTGQVNLGEGWLPQDFTPVEFAQPGEPGFLDTLPKYDCDDLTASLGEAPQPENRDDL